MCVIMGRLVVLSVFMLVFGATSTTAQTGQDERCADFTGQAHGLCTAAISNGCFDGVESRACENGVGPAFVQFISRAGVSSSKDNKNKHLSR
jgi:hypothetical protein